MLLDLFRRKPEPPADPREIRSRTDLLNYFIATYGYRRYLEIGVRHPRDNFTLIQAAEKDGVDPAARCNYRMTSDEFFRQLGGSDPGRRYDLIFVDGLHLADQVEKDVINSLQYLGEGGSIVLHDCNPLTEHAQIETYKKGQHWNGTVWQAWAKLRGTRPDLFMCVIDIDEGCGVIRKGRQSCFAPWPPAEKLSYDYLVAHRKPLLNLVSMEEFLRLEEEFKASRAGAAAPV
jgi:hypothetical protein